MSVELLVSMQSLEIKPAVEFFVGGSSFVFREKWYEFALMLDRNPALDPSVFVFNENVQLRELLSRPGNGGTFAFLVEHITRIQEYHPRAIVYGPLAEQYEEIKIRAIDQKTSQVDVKVLKGLVLQVQTDTEIALLVGTGEINGYKGEDLKFIGLPDNQYKIELDVSGLAVGQENEIAQANKVIAELGSVFSQTKKRKDVLAAITAKDPNFFSKIPRFEMQAVSSDVRAPALFKNVNPSLFPSLMGKLADLQKEMQKQQPTISSAILLSQTTDNNKVENVAISTTNNSVNVHEAFGYNKLVFKKGTKYADNTKVVHDEPDLKFQPETYFKISVPYKRLVFDKVALRKLLVAIKIIMAHDPAAKLYYDKRYGQFTVDGKYRNSASAELRNFITAGWLSDVNVVSMIVEAIEVEMVWCKLSNFSKKGILNRRLNTCVESFGQRAPVFLKVADKLKAILAVKKTKHLENPVDGAGHQAYNEFKDGKEAPTDESNPDEQPQFDMSAFGGSFEQSEKQEEVPVHKPFRKMKIQARLPELPQNDDDDAEMGAEEAMEFYNRNNNKKHKT